MSVTIASVKALNIPIVEGVKEYARGNYEKGWDYVVECWEDADIERVIENTKALHIAIGRVSKYVKIRTEMSKNCW